MQDSFGSKDVLGVKYSQLVTRFDQEYGAVWMLFNQPEVPCFNLQLLEEIFHQHDLLERSGGYLSIKGIDEKIRYSILGSMTPKVFNLGGQLDLFRELIRGRDREALRHYAIKCIDVIAQRVNHFKVDLTTITLIQGDALGGGLEAALTSDIIIAEKGSLMGFPEILFNLFPGMGAYSLVARKIGTTLAEKIILSGKMYSAEELHEMGLVDVVAEPGEGVSTVLDFMRRQDRRSNGFQAVQKARQRFNPVTYQELLDITMIWVESALKLTEKDLKVMDRLVRSQEKLFLERKEQTLQLSVA